MIAPEKYGNLIRLHGKWQPYVVPARRPADRPKVKAEKVAKSRDVGRMFEWRGPKRVMRTAGGRKSGSGWDESLHPRDNEGRFESK